MPDTIAMIAMYPNDCNSSIMVFSLPLSLSKLHTLPLKAKR